MSKTIVTKLMRQQIVDLWGRGQTALVASNYAAQIVDHMPVPDQPVGRDALAGVVTAFRRAFPDMKMTLHGTIASDVAGVDFWTMTGTHKGPLFGQPATGRRVSISGIDMVHVAGGRITDLWHVEEMLQLAAQIGQHEVAFGTPVAPIASTDTNAEYDPGRFAKLPSQDRLSPLETRNLAIARDHVENIWARGDMVAAYRLYAPDVIDHQPAPGQRKGIVGIVDVLGWLREAVPDLRMEIAEYVVEGSLAADRWIMRGTHTGAPLMGIKAAGRGFEINGMDVIRIRDDGLISDVWHVEEFARLKSQIAG